MFKDFLNAISICAIASYSVAVNAIEISTMFNVADNTGQGVFTVKNNTLKRIFLNIGMSEIKIEDGDITKTPYDRSNIDEWKISSRPARTVIDAGFEKDIRVSLDCTPSCESNTDQVFQLTVVPTPYVEDERLIDKTVQMAIGFGPMFIIPAKEPDVDYDANYLGNVLTLQNNGNTFLNLMIDGCGENNATEECQQHITLLAGRKLEVELKDQVLKPRIKITATTHGKLLTDERYIDRG